MRKTLSLIWLLVLLATPAAFANSRIAIIIDDMGNNATDLQALELSGNVTFSILPFTPFSREIAMRADQLGRDVMLHIPMEALAGNRLGPGAITEDMSDRQIYSTLNKALLAIPNAIGMNNHMGSKLTQLTRPMTTTMRFLRDNQLMFVDSRTTRYSQAEKIARKVGVEALHRHVFLDHYPNKKQIELQFNRLLKLAEKQGYAIGIAHPYPETIAVLKAHLDKLDNSRFELVSAAHLLTDDPVRYALQPKSLSQAD